MRMRTYRLTIAVCITSCLLVFVFAVVSRGDETNKNKEALLYGTNVAASSDLFNSNGGDFFVVGDKLYVLLWTLIADQPQGGAENSVLAFTSPNSTTWTTISIPGKAYYLGPKHNNEICSIQPLNGAGDTWLISFYDISGRKLKELAHKYKKKSREYYHFMPVPIGYPDGSLIFYAQYLYETRNPIVGLLLSLISGGHGWEPRIGDSIEIVPELIEKKNNIKPTFEYLRVRDMSRRRTVMGIEQSRTLKGYKISHEEITAHDVVKYEMDNKQILFYGKDGFGIGVSDRVHVYNTLAGVESSVSLPPFPKEMSLNGKLNDAGTPVSDIFLMNDNSILYVIKDESRLHLFFFNQKEARWTRNQIDFKDFDQTDIRIIHWQGYVYVGMWRNLQLFKVMRMELADLMTDGNIQLSEAVGGF